MNIQRKKLGTAILLLLACGVVGFFFSTRLSSTPSPAQEPNFFPDEKKPSDITKIIVTKNGSETVISTPAENSPQAPNDQSKWVITSDNNAEADSANINQLIILAKEMNVRSIASENKNSLPSFDLDESHARRLQLFSHGTQIADILVGKGGTGGASSYVTSANESRVYLMDRNLTILLDLDFRTQPEKE